MTAALILAALRCRARRHALWMEQQWRAGRASPDQGLAITAAEVARLLQSPTEAAAEAAAFAATPEVAALTAPIATADAALAADPAWRRLIDNFALTPPETELLALALAEALAPAFGRIIAYLNDDTGRTKATPALAARLYHPDAYPDLADLPPPPLDALLNWRLATPVNGQAAIRPDTEFQPDPALAAAVATGVWTDRQLHGIATLHDPGAEPALPVLHPDALDRMLAASRTPVRLCIDLLGLEGSGRRTLAGQLAAALGRPLLVIDAARLAAAPLPDQLAVATLAMARARNAVLHLRHADRMPALPPDLAAQLDILRALPPDAAAATPALVLRLVKPDAATRLRLWRHLTDLPPPLLVASQRLTPGEIALVAQAPPGDAAARAALRHTAPPANDILLRLDCPYDWDDLVLPPELRAQLQEFAAQIRLRWEVYEDWGFDKLAHLGLGIAALFAGPSGTGKTMAAQVLARALDLDLYRVDLAGVVNKYIGETEKRLRDVFAFGERSGTLLFFDEADALFGSRMQVKDSHDRFANIEIDYLLQRIERFDGIAILATNRKADVDTAFLRRLRFVVDFQPPGPAERLAIWRKALPETTPAGAPLLDRIDWPVLADRLTLTGADIKSAALAAAFLARAEGSRIAMRHLMAAVQREMAKRGQILRLVPKAAEP